MLNKKQKVFLRSLAQKERAIFQVGKEGLSDNSIKTISDALRKRELIKLRVLENSGWTAREAADAVAQATDSDVVQVIGSKFVLFKRNPKEPVIEGIPKDNK